MVSSFYSGISGVKTYQFGIDSWSNNIANINTTGYKGDTPEFKTLFSSTMSQSFHSSVTSNVGNGATVGSNALITTNGELALSEDPFDLAITDDGYFVVGTSGITDLNENYFSRNGDFHRDADGYLVNNQGYYLYGIDLGKISDVDDTFTASGDYEADKAKLISNDPLTPLRIPDKIYYKPVETTVASVQLNLNANENLKSIDAVFTTTDPVTGNSSFDLDTFRNQDMNAIGASNDATKELFPFSKGLTGNEQTYINVDIETKTVINGVETLTTETHQLKYGDDVDGFTNIGEFMDKFAEITGTVASVGTGTENSPQCMMYFTLPDNDNVQNDTYKNIKMSSNVASLIDSFGFPANIDLIEGTSMTSNILYVPTYTSAVEIYDESGVKHQIVADYYMQSKDDLTDDTDQEIWKFKANVFDIKGNRISTNNTNVYDMIFESNATVANIPAEDITLYFNANAGIKYDPYGLGTGEVATTQNSKYLDSTTSKKYVDGCEEGISTEIGIDTNGIINLTFSNGKSEAYGRVGIASFINDQGLKKIDSTTFKTLSITNIDGNTVTSSGEPKLMWLWNEGAEESGEGRISLATTSIVQKRLETSNILMATALTELMISQRAYSANAKSITTSDELLQQAIALKK